MGRAVVIALASGKQNRVVGWMEKWRSGAGWWGALLSPVGGWGVRKRYGEVRGEGKIQRGEEN
jgi:hypothetical protein